LCWSVSGNPIAAFGDQTLSAKIPYTSIQDVNLPKASRELGQIRRQLSTAQDFGHKVVAGLETAPIDDGTPLDAQTILASRDAYVLIRAAYQGLGIVREKQRVPDPIIDLAFSRLNNAWNLSRTAVEHLFWGMTRQEYLEGSVRDLGQALRLVDQALVLLP
jgi:hypothetical protein